MTSPSKKTWSGSYYLFIFFDFLIIIVSLIIIEFIVISYSQAVTYNGSWSEHFSRLKQLGSATVSLNRPGNDLFKIRDVALERQSLRDYQKVFDEAVDQFNLVLPEVPEQYRIQMIQRFDAVKLSVAEGIRLCEQIFQNFELGREQEAAAKMALMDEVYSRAYEEIYELQHLMLEEQKSWLRQQEHKVKKAQNWVILIFALIFFVILTIAFSLTRLVRSVNEANLKVKEQLDLLKLSEERFRKMISASMDAIVMIDAEGKVMDWNPAAEKMFGYSYQDALGQKISELLIPTGMRPKHEMGMKRLRETGHGPILNQRLQLEALHRDGHLFPIELIIVPAEFQSQTTYVGFLKDISAFKKYEDEILSRTKLLAFLEETQSEFIRNIGQKQRRELFDGMLQGVLELTQSQYGFIGEVLYDEAGKPFLKTYAISNLAWDDASRAFYDQHVVKGMEFHNLKTLFGAALDTGKTVISNQPEADPRRGGLPSGHPALHSFMGVPFGPSGGLVGMVGLANRPQGYDEALEVFLRPLWASCESMIQAYRDFERRAAIERMLVEKESRISAIVNSAVDAIITIDSSGLIQMFNPAAEKLFGYGASEILGMNINVLMPEPDRSRHNDYLARYLSTGEKHVIGVGREVMAKRKNGECFPVDLAVSEWVYEGQKMFVGILHDLTERKHLEHQTLQVAEEKSQFAAIVSHELRTPMAAISEGVRLLSSPKTGPLNEDQRELSALVIRNIDRLSRLVNDFLDFQKLETTAVALHYSDQSLNGLVAEVVNIMASQASAKNLVLKTLLFPEDIHVFCDADKVIQVLTNFINNAIKFTSQGAILVETALDDHGAARISVKDTGPGISPQDQRRLFKPFEQILNVEKGKPRGSGMGLAIAKRLIERHHGKVGVISQPGEGATFYFTLPLYCPIKP